MAIRLQDRRESSRATSRVNDSPPPDLSSLSWDFTHRQVAHGLADELRSTLFSQAEGTLAPNKIITKENIHLRPLALHFHVLSEGSPVVAWDLADVFCTWRSRTAVCLRLGFHSSG